MRAARMLAMVLVGLVVGTMMGFVGIYHDWPLPLIFLGTAVAAYYAMFALLAIGGRRRD